MNKNYFILISIIAWGAGGIFTKLASNEMSPVVMATVTTCMYLIALPIIISFYKIRIIVSLTGLMYAVISSIGLGIGSISYMFALQKGGAGETSALTGLYPAVTMLLSFVFLSEEVTIKKVIGCFLAVTSVYLLTNK